MTSRETSLGALDKECSHTRRTRHLALRSCALTFRSRSRFVAIFFFQNFLLVAGSRKHLGHPCQKHPSTNTATRSSRKTKSGLPGSLAWRRQPVILLARSRRTIASSVRSLPRPLIRDITSERFALVKTSATTQWLYIKKRSDAAL
jgi:hypothetical protein